MEIAFRPAKYSDKERLFRWRNDADTRASSSNPDWIRWSAHVSWLREKLSAPDCRLLVAESSGAAVGMVRFDHTDSSIELSWIVAPEHRGYGYGRAMVTAAMALEPSEKLKARILSHNKASIRIAEAVGIPFTLVAQ